jgi:hypothetical protein
VGLHRYVLAWSLGSGLFLGYRRYIRCIYIYFLRTLDTTGRSFGLCMKHGVLLIFSIMTTCPNGLVEGYFIFNVCMYGSTVSVLTGNTSRPGMTITYGIFIAAKHHLSSLVINDEMRRPEIYVGLIISRSSVPTGFCLAQDEKCSVLSGGYENSLINKEKEREGKCSFAASQPWEVDQPNPVRSVSLSRDHPGEVILPLPGFPPGTPSRPDSPATTTPMAVFATVGKLLLWSHLSPPTVPQGGVGLLSRGIRYRVDREPNYALIHEKATPNSSSLNDV